MRKQARRLENEIDVKLVAYSKVGSTSVPTTSTDTAPLLGEHVFDTLSMEIEQMLDKVSSFQLDDYVLVNIFFYFSVQLTDINDKMSEIPLTSDSYMIHTLQRHREILNVCLWFAYSFLPLVFNFICHSYRDTNKNLVKFKQIIQLELNERNYFVVQAFLVHH